MTSFLVILDQLFTGASYEKNTHSNLSLSRMRLEEVEEREEGWRVIRIPADAGGGA
jgi:hypothetical protein